MADFKKAFDSLDGSFMFKTLDFLNFGLSFKQGIKTLYKQPVGKVKNNGYISETFSIYRGIRQGCPVSALIFILSVEILGLKIRQHDQLKGFMFGYEEKPIKVMQYADDCILFLNDKNELCTAISLLHDFQHVSGLELNLSKCEGVWLGRDKNKQEKCTLFGIKCPKQIRCLGIYVGHSEETNVQQNWTNKLEKVEQILES